MDLYSRPRCAFCRFGRLAALLIGAVQFDIVGEKRIMVWYMHVPAGRSQCHTGNGCIQSALSLQLIFFFLLLHF